MRLLLPVLLAGAAWAEAVPSPAPGCPVAELEATLQKAGKKIAVVKSGAATFDLLATGKDEACRVRLFKSYWHFYGSVQGELATQLDALPPDGAAAKKLHKEIKSIGWSYVESEGGNYVGDASDWLLKRIGRLPAAWRAYMALRISDDREGFVEDGGLLISFTQLRKRLRGWEDFVAANPGFELNDQIFDLDKMYLAIFLMGVDNTPVFQDEVMRPEVRSEIEAYLADGKARDRKLVKGYYELVKKNGFQNSEAAQKYLEKRKITSMMGQEAPRF